ncbi:MAG: hypothetical protein NVSMB47_17440 [Polyangiales bacterium]
MRPNRVFFPQALLDAWMADERVDVAGEELVLKAEDRRFRIVEAMHVLRDLVGSDTHQLVGRVKTREQLVQLGAEVLETSMVLGEEAYDVVPGFIGEPVGSFAERTSHPGAVATPQAQNDEDLLASFLLKSL